MELEHRFTVPTPVADTWDAFNASVGQLATDSTPTAVPSSPSSVSSISIASDTTTTKSGAS